MELERSGRHGIEKRERSGKPQAERKKYAPAFYRRIVLTAVPLLAAMALVACWLVAARMPSAAAAPADSPGRITNGPCLLRVCRDRVALMWETDTEGPSGVSYGAKDGPEVYQKSPAEKVAFKGWAKGGRGTAYVHRLWLEGLTPGRTYSYRITGPGVPSETFQFRTVPAETDEVRFIVYGDTQIQPAVHRKLVEQMSKHEVDFIVHVGDLVAKGEDCRLWGPQFFEPLKGLMERVPIYIARGNHDGPEKTFKKLLAPPGEAYDFGFDYGPLHYFCADNASHWTTSLLLGRITRDAKNSRALWKFVSYHKPSLNFEIGLKTWQQRKALPAFAAAQIDFVLAGHSHHYERFRPVQPPGEGSCVTYITTGGGGGSLAPIEPTPCHACAESVYHFCLFHIRGDHLLLDVIDAEGRTIDHLDITKTDGRLDEPYRATALLMSVMQEARAERAP